MNGTSATVVFGSALGGGAPRDIDVAHTGDWNDRREAIVRQWAVGVGLQADLPLDLHQLPEGLVVTLPVPMGREAEYRVLEGEPQVRFQAYRYFTSGLRVLGGDAQAFLAALAEGNIDPDLSMLPEGESYPGEESGWDKYTSGLTALQSAARHAPVWAQIAAGLNCGRLLTALAAGQQPQHWQAAPHHPDGKPLGAGWSAAYTLRAGVAGEPLRFIGYALDTEVTEEEAAGLLGITL